MDGTFVNLQTTDKYISIDEQIGDETNERFIQHKSEKWHKLRSAAKVTGSTIYTALGCDGLARLKSHFEKVVCGIPDPEPTQEVKKAMEHGSKNEINAVATIVGKVLPVIEPDLVFCEEGCVAIHKEDGRVFMVVSPDGTLRSDKTLASTQVAVEIKCPNRKVHETFPPRYLLQCLCEIEVVGAHYLLYASWTSTETMIFKVERNQTLFQKAMKLALEMYDGTDIKKPSKLTQEMKNLKIEIKDESKKEEIIGRFDSCIATDCGQVVLNARISNADSLCSLLKDIQQCYITKYELNREKASEALVFLVADLDRSWDRQKSRSALVACFPKGYSLDCETMRGISELVYNTCHMNGLHITCQSFDGQWHVLVVRSVDNKPLTLYQLQRELWKEVEKRNKKDIMSELKSLNKTVHMSTSYLGDEANGKIRKVLVATNNNLLLPTYRKGPCLKKNAVARK